MPDNLTISDFTQINFGIICCDLESHSFIYQVPMYGDKRRHAQTGPCAVIGHKFIDVRDFDEALELFNKALKDDG